MARIVGLTVSLLLSVIAMTNGDTRPCTNSELLSGGTVQIFKSGQTTTEEFKLVTNNDGTKTFTRKERPSNQVSQQENCAVVQQDSKPAEIVMSFKIIGQVAQRYCWKAKLNNFVLFYVMSQAVNVNTGFTIEQCISQLADATSYRMMMKLPLPNEFPKPAFGVDMSEVMKPGTYRLTYSMAETAQSCTGNTVQQSSITITSSSVTFSPCGTATTSFQMPFKKELYIAGFVQDDMLDVVRNPNQVNGAFAVLVYTDGTNTFRYYLMRVSTSAFGDTTQETYLELFGLTNPLTAFDQTGFVDVKYILPANRVDLLTLRAYSDECLKTPCLNGGSCLNKWLNYTCICPNGFGGANCIEKEDTCAKLDQGGSLCSFQGTCVDTVDGYTCSCTAGYTGAVCLEQTTCLPTTCKNGGTCYDPKSGSVAICDCPQGWYGATCEETFMCAAKTPCQNQGTCYDDPTSGGYICTCATGFFGTNCDRTDPGSGPGSGPAICVPGMAEEVCLNDGVCVDSKCECKGYYIGRYCEEMNRWFIGSIVLIVLLAVVMIVTLIVCCFFCTRGRTLGTDGQEKSPYDPFDRTTYPTLADTNQGFGVVGLGPSSMQGYGVTGPGSTQGYGPTGFTMNQAAPVNESPLFLSNF